MNHPNTTLNCAGKSTLTPVATQPALHGDLRRFPQPDAIHRIFEARVAAVPVHGTVRFEDEAVAYPELNARANRLAHWLLAKGAGRGDLIGVCLEPSVELIVALLAVLKTGAAFVPLDPGHPRDRLEFVAADSRVKWILGHAQTAGLVDAAEGRELVDLDVVREVVARGDASNPVVEVRAEDIIYVMYTSGSTGRPKGAILTHAGIRNRLLWGIDEYRLGVGSSVLFKTSIAFDVCIWEIFAPLLSGADLVIAKQDGNRDIGYLLGVIRRHRVTHADFVPSMMSLFLAEIEPGECGSLRVVTCAGEALTAALLDQIFAKLLVTIYNLYGPTEASLAVTYWSCTSTPPDREVPIGRPMSNVSLHVLDEAGAPVRVGEAGELYIGGVAPGLGYLNLPERSRASFVPDGTGGTHYRTGDLVRVRDDGTLLFLGRIDDQVKLRGVRIELGEIEENLRVNPLVQDAVVLVREFGADDLRLVAHLALRRGAGGEPADAALARRLREPLERVLPAMMIPYHYVIHDRLPLTSNGKADRHAIAVLPLDREALTAPAVPGTRSGASETVRQTPAEIESLLLALWRDVLGNDAIGTDDDFFELGGHSLTAAKIVSRFKVHSKLAVSDLFQHRTIRALAELVVSRNAI